MPEQLNIESDIIVLALLTVSLVYLTHLFLEIFSIANADADETEEQTFTETTEDVQHEQDDLVRTGQVHICQLEH